MQLGMLKMSGNFMSTEEGTIKKKENNRAYISPLIHVYVHFVPPYPLHMLDF